MNSGPGVLIVSLLLLQIAGGKDLYWQPNSNWGTPSNWALGRVPCGDAASLTSVPSNSVVYLDVDTTVQSISLPANGKLVLAPSVTIQLTPDTKCNVPGDTQPMAAAVENSFIGAATRYWECATNWRTEDASPVDHAPCGEDRAIFEQGAFSNVRANSSVIVRSLSVRGTDIQSQTQLSSEEFNLEIEVNSACGENPVLCPCPDEGMCPKPVSTEAPSIDVGAAKGSSNLGGIVGGVVFGIVVILAVVAVVVVIVMLYLRRRSAVPYTKDELLEEGDAPDSTTPAPDNLYDNPVYDGDPVKVDLSMEKVGDIPEGTAAVPGMTTYEADPPLYADLEADDEKRTPKLNQYERF